jgi:hypothetical protein
LLRVLLYGSTTAVKCTCHISIAVNIPSPLRFIYGGNVIFSVCAPENLIARLLYIEGAAAGGNDAKYANALAND